MSCLTAPWSKSAGTPSRNSSPVSQNIESVPAESSQTKSRPSWRQRSALATDGPLAFPHLEGEDEKNDDEQKSQPPVDRPEDGIGLPAGERPKEPVKRV